MHPRICAHNKIVNGICFCPDLLWSLLKRNALDICVFYWSFQHARNGEPENGVFTFWFLQTRSLCKLPQ